MSISWNCEAIRIAKELAPKYEYKFQEIVYLLQYKLGAEGSFTFAMMGGKKPYSVTLSQEIQDLEMRDKLYRQVEPDHLTEREVNIARLFVDLTAGDDITMVSCISYMLDSFRTEEDVERAMDVLVRRGFTDEKEIRAMIERYWKKSDNIKQPAV